VSGSFGEWHQAIALAFAQTHSQKVSGCVHVVKIEAMRFSVADAGSVESFHQGAITDAECGPCVRSFDQSCDI